MTWLKDIAVVAIPVLISQIGEGVREALKHNREVDDPCEHGIPGGILCAKCYEKPDKPE